VTVQQPPKPDIDGLHAKVGAALDAVLAVEQSDDMAYSNGSHARAMQVFMDATKALTDALREENAE
jgi:hypothetical protein